MREIKFRVQNFKKQWVYFHLFGIKPIYSLDETLGEFTGLCDKNGKEIYEGDLLKLTNRRLKECIGAHREILLVGFNHGSFMCARGIDPYNMDTYLYLCSGERVEIIGNIYENPELLNEDK